ncbi:hypothetical protein G9A89_023477 [Geosiphon pyriformis]|nr:hypothetical protein G9A89_023477 [Geosiphon pyriformis]
MKKSTSLRKQGKIANRKNQQKFSSQYVKTAQEQREIFLEVLISVRKNDRERLSRYIYHPREKSFEIPSPDFNQEQNIPRNLDFEHEESAQQKLTPTSSDFNAPANKNYNPLSHNGEENQPENPISTLPINPNIELEAKNSVRNESIDIDPIHDNYAEIKSTQANCKENNSQETIFNQNEANKIESPSQQPYINDFDSKDLSRSAFVDSDSLTKNSHPGYIDLNSVKMFNKDEPMSAPFSSWNLLEMRNLITKQKLLKLRLGLQNNLASGSLTQIQSVLPESNIFLPQPLEMASQKSSTPVYNRRWKPVEENLKKTVEKNDESWALASSQYFDSKKNQGDLSEQWAKIQPKKTAPQKNMYRQTFWKKEEEDRLLQGVRKYGASGHWKEITAIVATREVSQVKAKWGRTFKMNKNELKSKLEQIDEFLLERGF